MTTKVLSVNPKNCNGCRDCETACAARFSDDANPAYSRIRVIDGNSEGTFFLPTTCQHCDDPPCMAVCPNAAIYRDNELNRVVINLNLCIGCKLCVSACPFGAMGFDNSKGFAFKCDLCDGDPKCVGACETAALEYIDGHKLNHARMRESADKHYAVLRHQV